MEFLKNNLFYVVLVAVVLVISIPSYVLASKREAEHAAAVADATQMMSGIESRAKSLMPVSDAALKKAGEYQKGWEGIGKEVEQLMTVADNHMDHEFITPVGASGLPDPVAYKSAYGKAYDELVARLEAAKLCDSGPGKSPLLGKADWPSGLPDEKGIRITQKQYWILKELVDIMTDPACHVRRISRVALDIVPNGPKTNNYPDDPDNPAISRFWIYPLQVDFQMDFRYFPVLLGKLADDDKVIFVTDRYQMTRGFSKSDAVYEPVVAVSLYCLVYDYISTDFEKANLAQFRPAKGPAAAKKKGK